MKNKRHGGVLCKGGNMKKSEAKLRQRLTKKLNFIADARVNFDNAICKFEHYGSSANTKALEESVIDWADAIKAARAAYRAYKQK